MSTEKATYEELVERIKVLEDILAEYKGYYSDTKESESHRVIRLLLL